MRVCVWDTETTGFPVREWTLDQQPHIIQFAAIIWEISEQGDYSEIERHDILIRPKISIPFAASQVHGLYDRDLVDKPYIEDSIDKILKVLNSADVVAGHNIEYDETVLAYELARMKRVGEYTPMKSICTMRSSTEYCKLQWRWLSYKPPKLSELHKFLFEEWFEWAHNAMVDVEATMRSFVELVKRNVIVLESTNTIRLF